MRQRLSRPSRFLKWACTGLALVGVLIWLPNRSHVVRYIWPATIGGDGVWIGNGCVGYCGYVVIAPNPRASWIVPKPTGCSFGDPLEDCDPWIGTTVGFFGTRVCCFPASLLAVVFGAAAALLWWRDRPYPVGRCRNCGYDLTGNVSGVCPECGERI
jgi:hypothetical protein